jgi:glutamate-1-semialdehyde aminotransferase
MKATGVCEAMKKKYPLEEIKNGLGVQLYDHAKKIIPGGTQLLSKRPEMFAPEVWPAYYSKAKGSKVWDLNGREFLDMSIMSVGACILGYADDEVDDAVIKAIRSGVSSSLNCPEEVELTELMLELHPWFHMARYTRSGGEAMSVAVRIARSKTKRDRVLFSGYHGWTDWYLAANLGDGRSLDGQLMPGLDPSGVPRSLEGSAISFLPDSVEMLKALVGTRGNEIAAIVIEPARGEAASEEYLSALKTYCDEIGAILIFDEITSGFRECAGGYHRMLTTKPDLAVFAKSIANGYPIAMVIGIRDVMEAAQNSFISSTNWTDKVGPAAAIATITKYRRENVSEKIKAIGKQVQNMWAVKAENFGLDISVTGIPTLAAFQFNTENSVRLNTVFTRECLQYGVLGFRQFKASFAHSKEDLDIYSQVIDSIFDSIANDLSITQIDSPDHHVGFKRLTKE